MIVQDLKNLNKVNVMQYNLPVKFEKNEKDQILVHYQN